MQVLSGPRGTCTNAGSAEMPGWNGRDGKNCVVGRSEEHTSELQSQSNLVCRLLLEKKNRQPIELLGVQAKLLKHVIGVFAFPVSAGIFLCHLSRFVLDSFLMLRVGESSICSRLHFL